MSLPLWTTASASSLSLTSQTRQLAHIPTIGFGNPILSYFSYIQLLLDPPGFLKREWSKVGSSYTFLSIAQDPLIHGVWYSGKQIPPGTKYVKVPSMARWVVFPVHPEGYQEISRAPDSRLSITKASEDVRPASLSVPSCTHHSTLLLFCVRRPSSRNTRCTLRKSTTTSRSSLSGIS